MAARPTISELILSPVWDPAFMLLVALGAGLYALGVRRLARRDPPRRWSRARSTAFGGGLVIVAVATLSGLARYDTVLISYHTLQHVLLGMAAPLLLALGAPMTLALQASRRGTKGVLLAITDHPIARWVSHPVVAWVVFGGSLVVIYWSPLLELSLRNDVIHTLIHLHFVAAGWVFCWVVVGLDPGRHHLGPPARAGYVLLAVPVHAFIGLALYAGATEPLAASFYGEVARDWGPSLVEAQRAAAGILWGVGELFGVACGAVVFAQWVREDRRRAAREDREAPAGRTAT